MPSDFISLKDRYTQWLYAKLALVNTELVFSVALEAHYGDICELLPSTREDKSRHLMNKVLMTVLSTKSCLWPLQETSPKMMCFTSTSTTREIS